MLPRQLNGWQRLWVVVSLFYGLVVVLATYETVPRESAILERWAGNVINLMQENANHFAGGEVALKIRSSEMLGGKSDLEVADDFVRRVASDPPRVVARFRIASPERAEYLISAPYWTDEQHVLAVARKRYEGVEKGPWEKYAQRNTEPSNSSIEELERAALNADRAGDKAALRKLDAEIAKRREEVRLSDFGEWWNEERPRQRAKLNALERVKQAQIDGLLMSQLSAIGWILAVWVLPMLALYLAGMLVRWVFRGFYPKKIT